MAIQCQKCLYIMSKSEAFGYMAPEIYKFFKDILIPCLIQYYAKRGIQDYVNDIAEGLIIGTLTNLEIKCHVCMKYHGWSQNISPLKFNESQPNQKEVL